MDDGVCDQGRNCDTIFQEVNLDDYGLLFEWRASQHRIASHGTNRSPLPIQSVDKDDQGNYLISTGNAVVCLSGENGQVLWQLGGDGNEFQDASDAATSLSHGHRASWHSHATLLITNDYSSDARDTSQETGSAAKLIRLDIPKRTATVAQSVHLPHGLPSSLDTFQFLNTTVLAHAKTNPTVIEFSDHEILCETHLAAARLPSSLTPSYRVSKHAWSGYPDTQPQIAVCPEENAIYVSWNGATDVDSWVLQSGPSKDGNTFIDHLRVPKEGFETKIDLPRRTEEYIRVIALDRSWKLASMSAAVSRKVGHAGSPHLKKESLPRHRG
jgi:hypothetical protein